MGRMACWSHTSAERRTTWARRAAGDSAAGTAARPGRAPSLPSSASFSAVSVRGPGAYLAPSASRY
ncbi:hypothetical protein, partial [Nocardiopsis dassonvillei]|uniref:hypothetical protein n=1 Tax=Nocardiopsis dassonvillei TaxID=2014 RepID=UPI001B34EC10